MRSRAPAVHDRGFPLNRNARANARFRSGPRNRQARGCLPGLTLWPVVGE